MTAPTGDIECKHQFSDKINYVGEINDLYNSDFYKSIDVLFRSDLSFRTGRTVLSYIFRLQGCLPYRRTLHDEDIEELSEFLESYLLLEKRSKRF